MNALTPQQRIRHGDLAAQLISAVVDFKELPNGYAASIGGIKAIFPEFCILLNIALRRHLS